jgi:hypothetical protein
MYVKLFHDQEHLVGTAHEKIFLWRSRDVDWQQTDEVSAALEAACRVDDERLLDAMTGLVPEFLCGPCVTSPAPSIATDKKVLALPAARG